MGFFRKYDQPCCYDIRVMGCTDPKWADRFDGLAVLSLEEAETLLTGPIADQAALHGTLAVIRNLRLTLLSIKRVEVTQEIENASVNMTTKDRTSHIEIMTKMR
jgi:hypothetical protein